MLLVDSVIWRQSRAPLRQGRRAGHVGRIFEVGLKLELAAAAGFPDAGDGVQLTVGAGALRQRTTPIVTNRVDHEHVPFPMADGIAEVGGLQIRRMIAIEIDAPVGVVCFKQEQDLGGRLDDFIAADVVAQ